MIKIARTCLVAAVAAGVTFSLMAESAAAEKSKCDAADPKVEIAVNVVEAGSEAFESVGLKPGEKKQLDAGFCLGKFLERADVKVLASPRLLERSGRNVEYKSVTEYIYPTGYNVMLPDDFEDTFGKEALEMLREAGRRMGEDNLKMTIGKLASCTNGALPVVEPKDFAKTEVGVTVTVTPKLKGCGIVELRDLSFSVVDEPTWKNYGPTLTKQGASADKSCVIPMEHLDFPVRKVESRAVCVPAGTVMAFCGPSAEDRGKGKVWLLVFVTSSI